jgi:hypothetical protein
MPTALVWHEVYTIACRSQEDFEAADAYLTMLHHTYRPLIVLRTYPLPIRNACVCTHGLAGMQQREYLSTAGRSFCESTGPVRASAPTELSTVITRIELVVRSEPSSATSVRMCASPSS